MSRTYRCKNIKIPKHASHELVSFGNFFPWYWIKIEDKKKLKKEIAKWRSDAGWHGDYCSNPSWWNRLYTEVPNRRKTKKLLRKVKTLTDYEEAPLFPLAKKPYIYYW